MYLLGTQALADVVSNAQTAVRQWVLTEDLPDDEVVASAASFTLLRSRIGRHPGPDRGLWERLFLNTLRRFRASDCVLPVSLDIALRAAELRNPALYGNGRRPGDLYLLVVATALDEDLTLVDNRQTYHSEFESRHGLSFLNPYQP